MNSRVLKEMAHSHFPLALRAYNSWAGRRYRSKTVAQVFCDIHRDNGFKGVATRSGPGSEWPHTEKLRRELPRLFQRHAIKTLLDAPCGDLNWMRDVLHRCALDYIGADIVPELIRAHTERFWTERVRFIEADITRDALPAADAILCRDCLVHLSNDLALGALKNFQRTGTRLLLATHYPATRANIDIVPGLWRAMNLQLPPFTLPAPVDLLVEECAEKDGEVADKTLALFDLAEWKPDPRSSRGNETPLP